MTERETWQRFTALPADAQKQVAELISFLHTRLEAEVKAQPEQPDVETEEFFGIWRGREDLEDSSAWVRELRKEEWSTHR